MTDARFTVVPFERTDRLPPDPSSPGRARAFVTTALHEAHRDEDAEVAALLVSETVTNAVLHAGTDLEVHCRVDAGVVRVEVRDGSPVMPGLRHYGDSAVTGRGLGLVEALAQAWGIEGNVAGKTVWFELGTPAGGPATEGHPPTQVDHARTVVIRFRRLPVALVRVTVQYGDAVLRELALLAAAEGPRGGTGLHGPQLDLTPILDPVDAAWEEGTTTLDLDVTVPAGAATAALERVARIDEADRMAREGVLLAGPAVPEVTACRRWLFGQITVQAEGGPATAWELPAGAQTVEAPATLPAQQRAALGASTVAAVVADEGNHIVFANDATTGLLGWPVAELVGRRLTTIIPPELREAHLVGFTRYLLTGVGALLGRTVRVPALHRDGRRLPVDLLIETVPGDAGRPLFRATLRPADPGD